MQTAPQFLKAFTSTAAVVFAFSSVSCKEKNNVDECLESTDCGNGNCEHKDPYLHPIVTHGCLHSGECPSGTVCSLRAPAADGGVGDGMDDGCQKPVIDTDSDSELPQIKEHRCNQNSCKRPGLSNFRNQVCRLPDINRDYRSALLGGFRVPSFKLSPLSLETPEDDLLGAVTAFSWKGPDGTEVVSCMVFGCPPEIIENPDNGDRSIVNHQLCTLGQGIQRGSSGTLELGDSSFKNNRNNLGLYCYDDDIDAEKAPMQITHLLVGCLAYGAAELIGATSLVEIAPEALKGWCDKVIPNSNSASCSGDCNGYTCAKPGTTEGDTENYDTEMLPKFGTWCDGLCLPRCVADEDCMTLMKIPSIDIDAGAADTSSQDDDVEDTESGHADSSAADTSPKTDSSTDSASHKAPYERHRYVGVCKGVHCCDWISADTECGEN